MDVPVDEALAALEELRGPGGGREIVHVRRVGPSTVEVYELTPSPAGQVETATVLRRSRTGWQVEGEAPAVPDDMVLRLLTGTPADEVVLDLPRFTSGYRATFRKSVEAEAAEDGSLVLRGEFATVTLRVEPAGPVRYLPQQTGYFKEFYGRGATDESRDEARLRAACAEVRSAVVLTAPPPPDPEWEAGEGRALILRDVADFAEILARQVPRAVVVPGGGNRRLTTDRFKILNQPANQNEYLCFSVWCLVRPIGRHLVTEGLRHFGHAEVEMPLRPGTDRAGTAADRAGTAADRAGTAADLAAIAMGGMYSRYHPGERVGPGPVKDWKVVAGRLGPSTGTSYGRWGSAGVRPPAPTSGTGPDRR